MKNLKTVTAKSQGKCIISGEHSVILNSKAIAMALDKYTYCELSTHNKGDSITIHLNDLAYHETWNIDDLLRIKCNIDLCFQNHLLNKGTIEQVISKPEQLALYTIAFMFNKFHIPIRQNLIFTINSEIEINSGMGSSAACICSILKCINEYANLSLSYDELQQMGQHIENLIHGTSSGIDISLSLLGGMVIYNENFITHQQYKNKCFTVIHTGKSANSTAECVNSTMHKLSSSPLINDMTKTTENIIHNITNYNIFELVKNIRENHRQLQQLAIVPNKINNFIQKIEQLGGACKISGAGALQGEKAGILVMVSNDIPIDIIKDFGYDIIQMPYLENNNKSISS